MDSSRRVHVNAMYALRNFPSIPVIVRRGAIGGLSIFNPSDWLIFFGRRNGAVQCVSQAMRTSFINDPLLKYVLPPKRLEVIYHYVGDTERISREESRRDLGVERDALVVGTVCNVRAVKNLSIVASTITELGRVFPNLRFVIIGGTDDSAEVRRIKACGDERSLAFAGPRREAPRYLSAFDIFVSPTNARKGEGFGLAIAEAMRAGLPIISSNLGGGAELVDYGASGLVVGPKDHAGWRSALERMCHSEDERRVFGARARQRVEQLLDPAMLAAEIVDMYSRRIATAQGTPVQGPLAAPQAH